MKNKKDLLYSYYRIRKIIGILGIALPILVFVFYGDLLSSISHYYYTRSVVFFTSILFAFGLFLISYKGYELDKDTEIISDNVITHIGGIAVLLVIFFPTSCIDSNNDEIYTMCLSEDYPLFGHNSKITSTIHFICAGIFLFSMGYMSIFRFSKGEKQMNNKVYKICGYTIWISIGIILIEFIVQKFYAGFYLTDYDVYFLETIAVFAFGISWLVKGEAIKDIIDFNNKYILKRKK